MTAALKPQFLEKFSCTGPACPDVCCNRFTVLVDPKTLEKYENEAPELLDFITEKEGIGKVLAFDKTTGCCPKMEEGSCTIHAKYGTDFLTDVCHLYPRITRKLGDQVVMSGTVSCPEIARLALFEDDSFEIAEGTTDRVPFNVKDYAPGDFSTTQALALNARFITLAGDADSGEQMLAKLAFFALRFGDKPYGEWDGLLDAGWRVLDAMLPAPEADPRDPFFLLILLTTLLAAGKIKPSARLAEVLSTIETTLHCRIDADQAVVDMQPDSMERMREVQANWRTTDEVAMQPVLKKLVMAKLHSSMYPFAGLGADQSQRITWLAIQFATIRLGLMCLRDARGEALSQDDIILAVQTITRVLDHVNHLEFALPMIQEAGWLETKRLLGLLA